MARSTFHTFRESLSSPTPLLAAALQSLRNNTAQLFLERLEETDTPNSALNNLHLELSEMRTATVQTTEP